MAGLKAAYSAPTWPDINGSFLPASASDQHPFIKNLVNNNLMVHFIHRSLAYLILVISVVFYFRSSGTGSILFNRLRNWFLLFITAQVILGILTVINSTNRVSLAWFGVIHQFVAMLIIVVTMMVFMNRKTGRL